MNLYTFQSKLLKSAVRNLAPARLEEILSNKISYVGIDYFKCWPTKKACRNAIEKHCADSKYMTPKDYKIVTLKIIK